MTSDLFKDDDDEVLYCSSITDLERVVGEWLGEPGDEAEEEVIAAANRYIKRERLHSWPIYR